MKAELFGKTKDGQDVTMYTLENKNGMKAQFIDYGGVLVRLFVPDRNGKVEDITLGYDTVAEYEENGCFFGALIAPNANRIKDAKFVIDGTEYQLDVNDGPNNLHSHFTQGGHKRIWKAEMKEAENALVLSIDMADGEMGFPGNKTFRVTYTLTDDNELRMDYYGVSDKKTILNPTNHAYFNLGGHASGSIINEKLWLNASRYTEIVPGAIPTGNLPSVKGTVMDFTEKRRIGDDIDADFDQLTMVFGYDHNFCIDDWDGSLKLAADLTDEESGRSMKVFTTLPGIQFYAGNCITEMTAKDGVHYGKRVGLCLETDYYPNAMNISSFASPIYEAGQEYTSTTVYQFEF